MNTGGRIRTYHVMLILCLYLQPGFTQKIDLERTPETMVFSENGIPVLVYQKSSNSLNGQYARSNYVHPLFSLDGSILTEDFPQDHLHHRGIFWAWHQLFIDSLRIGDGWEIRDILWQVDKVKAFKKKSGVAGITAHVSWISPLWKDRKGKQRALINETTKLTVFPRTKGYRIIEFEIALRASQLKTRLGGSEDEKGYGGFSARIRLPDNIRFSGPDGEVKAENTPVNSPGWIDFQGEFSNANTSGLALFSHPDNPGYPNPWILREKASMQNAVFPYPGREPILIPTKRPLTLKYALIIHDTKVNLPALYKVYCISKK